jgi:TolB protein
MDSSQRDTAASLRWRVSRQAPPVLEPRYVALALLWLSAVAGCSAEISQPPKAVPDPTRPVEATEPHATAAPAPSPTPTALAPPTTGTIVYTCQPSGDMRFDQICLINPDGSGRRQLTTDAASDHFYPSLSPDGESVVFSANLDGPDEIYEMPLHGRPRRLTHQGQAYAPAISPDGAQIIYTQISDSVASLWLMNRDGSGARQLIRQAWDPEWSPDGEWILFASDRAGSVQLWRVRAAGDQLEQLTSMANLRGRSDWSPDGAWLATYAGEPWQREIVIIHLIDGSVQRLTDGGNNLAPSFSPDGEWIAFTSYRDRFGDDNGCEIYVMQLETHTAFRLTDNETCDWQPRWGN